MTPRSVTLLFFLFPFFVHGQLALQWKAGTCPLLTSTISCTAIAADHSGYSYTCGWTSTAAHIFKTSPAGNIIHDIVPDSTTGIYRFNDVMVDDSGFVYATGECAAGNFSDIATCKYDSAGNLIWQRNYGGADQRQDVGSYLALGDSGKIIVCGYTFSWATNCDPVLLAYDPGGNPLWNYVYSANTTNDQPVGLSADISGNIYSGDWNGNTFSVTSAGAFRWGATVSVTAQSFCADQSGNSYICGFSGTNCRLTAYSAAGNLAWDSVYVFSGGSNFFSVTSDAQSNVYVTGRFNNRLIVKKYASSGTPLWMYVEATNNTQGTSIHVKNGLVAVTGDKDYTANPRAITVALDTGGAHTGTHIYLGAGANWARNIENAIDDSGDILVGGEQNSGSCVEVTVLKYSVDPMGMEMPQQAIVPVYPNPSPGVFSLQFPNGETQAVIHITDVSGREVFCCKTETQQVTATLPGGLYFVECRFPDGKTGIAKLLIRE